MAIKRTNRPIVQREGGDAIFGEGTDSDVTIASGTTTLTKDMYYNNLTVNSGATLFTNGFRVFVKGTFTNNGTVGMPTATEHSVADGSGTIAGRQNALNPAKAWGTSTDPLSVTDIYDLDDAVSGWFITAAGTITKIGGGSLGTAGAAGTTLANPGAGGAGNAGTFPGASTGQAGGAGNAGNPGNPAVPGAGGAGGLGGGLVIIFAKTIAGSGTIVSQGRAGSAGSSPTPGASGNLGNSAPGITGYHTSGFYHHPAGSTGPNPGAGNPHPAGHNPHVPGTAHPAGHNPHVPGTAHPAGHNPHVPGNPHPAGHNPHVAGNYHGSGTHTSAHNPNTHVYWSNHNATSNAYHVPAFSGAHGTQTSAVGFSNHNGGVNKGGNHNPGHGSTAAYHQNGNHNSGHGSHHHPAGHNPHVAGNPHPAGHNPHVAGNPHPAGHNPHVPGTPHPAGHNPHVPGTPHPAGHNSGTHPHTAATVNSSTGAVTSNKAAAPTSTATNANYTGGTGGSAGTAGTANPGASGATGSTGGIVVVARNTGNAASQIGHSNYSKVIDL